jgi:YHS domain-containing protein
LAKDPVFSETVDEKRAKHVSKYKGAVFCFCAAKCRQTFDSARETFVLN